LDAPGTLHHIIIRGIEGTQIFRNDQDRQNFLSRIGPLVDKTGARILAWALMDNHVHLLMFSGPQGISKFMRSLLTGYAIWYNRRHQRIGHLFQNRYKSIVCEEDSYLLELVRYIHLNPLRAGVVQSVKELEGYPWCGHSVLVGRLKRAWQEKDYIFEHLGTRRSRALRAYRRFVEEGKAQGRRAELSGGKLIGTLGGWSQVLSLKDRKGRVPHDARILGRGDFANRILKEADRRLRRQVRTGERKRAAEDMIRRICTEEGVGEEELRAGGQRRKISRVRGRLSYHLCHELGMSMAEIARLLGVCTSAICKAIQHYESGIVK
jgi:REP element-mobilizing transposase RayT